MKADETKNAGADALVEQLRQMTSEVPTGASDRVWRRLTPVSAARRSRRSEMLVFAGCAVAAAVAVFLIRPPAPEVVRGEGFVAQRSGRGTLQKTERGLVLTGGTLAVSAWGEPVSIEVQGHHLSAEAAVFAVVAGESVEVVVADGVVLLDSTRIERNLKPGSTGLLAVQSLEPADASAQRRWRQAELALEDGASQQAVSLWSQLANDGLRTEAALLKVGQTELWKLNQPTKALGVFDELQRRFPTGSLVQEAALSRLEALMTLQSFADARAAAQNFQTRFPDSERLAEVQLISAWALWQTGEQKQACAELASLPASAENATRETLADHCRSLSSNVP